MTLVLEQVVSKNNFKLICLIICNIKLMQIWLLKKGPLLDIFWSISLKFLDCTILVLVKSDPWWLI